MTSILIDLDPLMADNELRCNLRTAMIISTALGITPTIEDEEGEDND